MPLVLGIDHRYIVLGALSFTTGLSIISTYKWLKERRKRDSSAVYESQKLLNEYLVFHYGAKQEILKYEFGPKDCLDFPKRCADMCLKHSKGFGKTKTLCRALDIGCAVGRSSFELAQEFPEVIGIDYSQSFVDACIHMRDMGERIYFVQDEGDLVTPLIAKISEEIDRTRCTFEQGDACDLRHDLGTFGCVLAANLICRLHSPYRFLKRLADLVAPGGILVITSPYTWLEEFTDKETWLGGYKKGGQAVTGFSTLKKELGSNFKLVEACDMPFFIRETARKNQWTVAHCTVWSRNIS